MHKKSVPLIRQMGTTDCGIAALTMIFQYYKYKIDISELTFNLPIRLYEYSDILAYNPRIPCVYRCFYVFKNLCRWCTSE